MAKTSILRASIVVQLMVRTFPGPVPKQTHARRPQVDVVHNRLPEMEDDSLALIVPLPEPILLLDVLMIGSPSRDLR